MRPKLKHHTQSEGGFTMYDVLFGAMAISIVAVASLQSLVTLNRNAAVNRMFSSARAVAQNDIDTALSDSWTTSASPTPPSMSGTTMTVPIDIRDDPRNSWGAVTFVTGTLTRTTSPVAWESGTSGVVTYLITGSVSYTYRGRTFGYVVSTMRSTDN